MNKFIVINESFVCANCGHSNEKLSGSCRNHCSNCLYSMHLDQESPGDRESDCHGLMQAYAISQNGKKGWMIHHNCLKCHKKILNKSAPDDNSDLIIELSRSPLYE